MCAAVWVCVRGRRAGGNSPGPGSIRRLGNLRYNNALFFHNVLKRNQFSRRDTVAWMSPNNMQCLYFASCLFHWKRQLVFIFYLWFTVFCVFFCCCLEKPTSKDENMATKQVLTSHSATEQVFELHCKHII